MNAWLGTRLVELRPGAAVLRLAPRPEFGQETGVVQGGILSALADTAAVYALWPQRPPGKGMTGVEFKVNFLRPVWPDGEDVVARSRVVRRGSALGVVDVDLEQAGRKVLTGTFTFFFFPLEAIGSAPRGGTRREPGATP